MKGKMNEKEGVLTVRAPRHGSSGDYSRSEDEPGDGLDLIRSIHESRRRGQWLWATLHCSKIRLTLS